MPCIRYKSIYDSLPVYIQGFPGYYFFFLIFCRYLLPVCISDFHSANSTSVLKLFKSFGKLVPLLNICVFIFKSIQL